MDAKAGFGRASVVVDFTVEPSKVAIDEYTQSALTLMARCGNLHHACNEGPSTGSAFGPYAGEQFRSGQTIHGPKWTIYARTTPLSAT